MLPTKAQFLAAAVKLYRARTSAASSQPATVFRQQARLKAGSDERFSVALTPDLVLWVRDEEGLLIVKSVPGCIERPDTDGGLLTAAQVHLLVAGATFFRHRTGPGCIYSPPLFSRRLQPHDSGFSRAYAVELSASLRLMVRDRRNGEVLAKSLCGKLDCLDLGIRLVGSDQECK